MSGEAQKLRQKAKGKKPKLKEVRKLLFFIIVFKNTRQSKEPKAQPEEKPCVFQHNKKRKKHVR